MDRDYLNGEQAIAFISAHHDYLGRLHVCVWGL